MNLFQTISASNYAILYSRFSSGMFTKYGGIRQASLSTNKGWQPKAVSLFSFIAACYFLKPVYFGITGAVNWVQQINYGNITSQLTLTGFTRRAAIALLCVKPSSYFKRYV